MKSIFKLILFSLFIFCTEVNAQNTYAPKKTGYINFNLQNSTLANDTIHQISLYGCNTSITLNKKAVSGPKGIKGPNGFKWKKDNQIVSGVPFGHQIDNDQNKFYISKYYIASPPLIGKGEKTKNNSLKKLNTPITDTIYDIGLITPDNFIFNGEKPVQMVYLNYNILKPVFIEYVNIAFDNTFIEKKDKPLVKQVPFKVECKDFPWINTKEIKNATGATGIGAFDSTIKKVGQQPNRLFLPYYYNNNNEKVYLDCKVTLLNDIILNYELFFMIDKKQHQTINLKEYYLKHGTKTVKIKVKGRKKLPCGCKPPKKKKQ